MLAGCVYRITSANVESDAVLSDLVGRHMINYSTVLIGGDLNINVTNTGGRDRMKRLFPCFESLNTTHATHFDNIHDPSLIDIFLSNRSNLAELYGDCLAMISFHHLLFY